jgi:ribosomal protein S18 acetylase RimI-like enzyme
MDRLPPRIDAEVTFRPAALADAPAIAAYHRRCWLETFAPLLAQNVEVATDPARLLAAWEERLAPGSRLTTVVADLDGRPIGHTAVKGDELVNLFVDPDHCRRGLGRALLAEGEALLAAAGHLEVELHTILGNEPALALYRSAGWTVTERLLHHRDRPDGLVFDEHVLVKRLPPTR